jgi:hypothetical protein
LGCCFWRTTGNHGSSSWNIWSKVRAPSNVKPAKAKYTNPGQKKMPWKSEGMEQYNQLHEEVRPTVTWRTEIRDQIQDRRRCLGRVREWSNTISYMKRCDRLSREGQRFEIKSRTEEDALEEWGNGAIQSATWRGATDCHVKDRDSRLNSKMKWNKKQAWHGGEREKQSNRLTWLLYMS